MATLYSIAVAANDRARGPVEHGHGVANRLQGIACPGLSFVALISCNRAECCNLPAEYVCKCKQGFEGDGQVECRGEIENLD